MIDLSQNYWETLPPSYLPSESFRGNDGIVYKASLVSLALFLITALSETFWSQLHYLFFITALSDTLVSFAQ